MFVQVVCDYPDYYDEYNQKCDGTKVYECNSFEELHNVLHKLNKENKLSHVHLDFCKKENTVQSFGGIVSIFKKGVTPFTTL